MRIPCPYCGDREVIEFSIYGHANPQRPLQADDAEAFHDYVYLRENIAGQSRELWYHASGCRRWLVVTRDTRTHHITSATFAAAQETAR